ncbi:eukaryotic translation initiation factor 5B-like [Impatiens glandulifera]|uniref:eukaryotic translation initiation factor 5B-like n=1 Tax=Impatiens glandulifera TaxID=253017 RepID=UPI001FB14C77|nr:eukaryotic translation initiation factor 5B-like [Impatiens glandulifera]
MASNLFFTEEEMVVDESLGYPKAFAKLCKDRSLNPYFNGPPITFIPYAPQQIEASKEREFDEMFPIIDPKAKPTTKPKIFVNLLWKQLNHLGNAGFDPETFRIDPYGNVLYYNADPDSPLAWEIDHWFPCSRGGLTVGSNLRILQWQVCKKKKNSNKLEFLIPWWDLQVGISINQFLSIFASSNADFRRRAFSWLFSDGENEELNDSHSVESHLFPQHFVQSIEKVGLAPASVVFTRKELNERPRSSSPQIGMRKLRSNESKENENPYQAIVMARDSLRQKEESVKMQAEIKKLDNEVNELKQKAEEEKAAIQELELVLIKRKKRAEKCRKVAEAQSSYRIMLEKMIREAMHQSVVYKEQMRLNQAASSALMARLEAQKAICDSSEKDLYRKYKHRDELEKQITQTRKRSRLNDDSSLVGDKDNNTILYLPGINSGKTRLQKEVEASHLDNSNTHLTLHKELRVFLEEEQKVSEEGSAIVAVEETDKLGRLRQMGDLRFPIIRKPEGGDDAEKEEDEETRKQRGKGNVEKWLKMLMEDALEEVGEGSDSNHQNAENHPVQENAAGDEEEEEIVLREHRKTPLRNGPPYKLSSERSKAEEIVPLSKEEEKGRLSFEKKEVARSDSARAFRRIPSSPSIIINMRKGVDCIRKKPLVIDDEEEETTTTHFAARNNSIKSSIKTIMKKAVKI